MTIPNYFEYIIRDDESVSTSPEEENSDTSQHEAKVEALSLYSVIGKACLACARPPTDLDDNNSATTEIAEDINGCIFSSTSVAPITRNEAKIFQFPNLKSFSFCEIKKASGNFRSDRVLGEGYLGPVFKGWIDKHNLTARKPGAGISIAVKKFAQQGLKGHKEWLGKVNYVAQLYHPNLMSVVGYCLENEHRLLVSEFMPQGSLKDHLWNGAGGSRFHTDWSLRMKIALGAAKALAFLHNAETKVIYGDFKSSNILLDSNYIPKLSYCGLVKDAPIIYTALNTFSGDYYYDDVYAEPYISKGLTTKSDVYSYGVVLLEMISGRLAYDMTQPCGERYLLQWAERYLYYNGTIYNVLDSRVKGQYSVYGFQDIGNLTRRCLSWRANERPNMDEIVTTLERLILDI